MNKKILTVVSIVAGVLLIAGGILAYLTLRPPTAEEISRYESLLSDGDVLFEAHEYSEAVEKYNEAVKVIHTDSRAYSKIVNIYLLKNDINTALEIAQKAQNRSTTAEASLIYAEIANAYFENRDFYNARMNYEIAASLNSNPKVNLGLSKAYVYDNEFNKAKKLLEKEYDTKTEDEAKLLYAYVLGSEDTDQAKDFLDSYRIQNSEMTSYFEQYSSVLEDLTEDELFNITKLSRIYVNNGYPSLAIRLLEPKLEDITQYVDALYFLGKAYLDSKQYDKAVETLLKSSSLIGYESNKYWLLARAYYKKDDLVNAVTYYDRAIGYAGDDLTRALVEEYLNVLLDSNQVSKAQEVYTDIVKTLESEWLYLIGLKLYYGESDPKFDYYLSKSVDMDMDDNQKKEYLFWKIRSVIDDSEVENIEQDFETLLELDRFNPYYYWMKGVYEMSLSNTSVARENFELALEYDLQGDVTEEVEDLLAQLK
jgi:tetratricopeptide (TPR) repeat protein